AGSVVHRVLEDLDLSLPVGDSLAECDPLLEAALAALCPADLRARTADAARGVLLGLRGGELERRLEQVRHHVVARELPVLLPAAEDDEAVAYVSGAIDLVHRDPEDGSWVVVDFKTDRVAGAHDQAERAARYGAQAVRYVRALQQALALPAPPRCELWFLAADRRVTADGAPSPGQPGQPRQLALTLD
ncbi:MAG: PD-(D/E)XK nuclease family protein, partial [Myxococcota bacterium]